jgi:hypothetical protein
MDLDKKRMKRDVLGWRWRWSRQESGEGGHHRLARGCIPCRRCFRVRGTGRGTANTSVPRCIRCRLSRCTPPAPLSPPPHAPLLPIAACLLVRPLSPALTSDSSS